MTDELEILFTEAREDLFNIYDEIYVSIWDGSIRIVFGRLGDKYYLAHAGVRLMRILWDLERLYGESLPPLTSQLGGWGVYPDRRRGEVVSCCEPLGEYMYIQGSIRAQGVFKLLAVCDKNRCVLPPERLDLPLCFSGKGA